MKKIVLAFMLVVGLTSLSACNILRVETEHAQGVHEDRILVGNTAVNTGDLAFVGAPFLAGMEAYFNMINESGGVLGGRNIELIHYSDGFDGETGNTYTQRLMEEDEVFAMVGHFGTPTVGATDEYLTVLGVPRVYYGTGTSLVYNENAESLGERASFPVQPVYEFEGELMVARAVDQLNAQRIGLLYTGNENGIEIREGMLRMAEELGVEVVDVLASGDMEAEALSLVDQNVDVIVLGMNQWSAISGVFALLTAGNDVPVIVSYVAADTSFADLVHPALGAFDIYANAWVDLLGEDGEPSDGYNTYVEEISKEHPEYANNSFAIAGWIAAMVFVEGLMLMDENEAITWEAYIEAMESGQLSYDLGADLDYRNGLRTGTQILSLLQMQYDSVEEATYFDIVAPMEHINDIVSRIEE